MRTEDATTGTGDSRAEQPVDLRDGLDGNARDGLDGNPGDARGSLRGIPLDALTIPAPPTPRVRRERKARPVRQRQSPEIRRAMIIAAARPLIAEQGMHATTIRDIASAADVAVGTVTYHFSGIAEVLAGVLDTEMAEFSAPVMRAAAAAPTGAAGLSALGDGLLADGPRAREHWALWLDFWTLAAHQGGYAEWQGQVYRELHALAADLFARGAVDGSVPAGSSDTARLAVEYIALMDGLVVQSYLPNGRLTPGQARAILAGAVCYLG